MFNVLQGAQCIPAIVAHPAAAQGKGFAAGLLAARKMAYDCYERACLRSHQPNKNAAPAANTLPGK